MPNRLLLKLLDELQPMFEEGRYVDLGSPCNTEKQGMCPFEIRTVMTVPFSHLRRFCSPFLAPLKVLNPHLVLLCSAQPCLAVSVLALAVWNHLQGLHCWGILTAYTGGVDQKRCCGLCDDFLCLCWTVPFCSKFSRKIFSCLGLWLCSSSVPPFTEWQCLQM